MSEWCKWRVHAVAYGVGMTRYDGYIDVYASDEDEARSKAHRELRRLEYGGIEIKRVEVIP